MIPAPQGKLGPLELQDRLVALDHKGQRAIQEHREVEGIMVLKDAQEPQVYLAKMAFLDREEQMAHL